MLRFYWDTRYIETLITELGINTTSVSPRSKYIPLTESFDEILKSHCKGPVKLIKRVKIPHSFLQSVSDQFHVIILSLTM